ncbi:MAG TPA: hypothetical protein EYG86_06530 [Crocinitomicaceae bacterium]|nr:hypothetical protein [Crocinitomicaceae bacterium]
MREELAGPKVENIGVAVVEQFNELNQKIYNVYLLNLSEAIIEGVMITSKGYGTNLKTGEKIKTSTLRHSIEVLLPNEVAKIEPIMEDVFGIANEFWVSFWSDSTETGGLVMHDKKFIFVSESISEQNMKIIPVLGDRGVLII